MHVELRYFADAREAAGCDRETVEVAEAACVGDALDIACASHPALAAVRAVCRVAIDTAFVREDTPLTAGATVALIPPVGGG